MGRTKAFFFILYGNRQGKKKVLSNQIFDSKIQSLSFEIKRNEIHRKENLVQLFFQKFDRAKKSQLVQNKSSILVRECVFVNSAPKIQCHIVWFFGDFAHWDSENTLPHIYYITYCLCTLRKYGSRKFITLTLQ